MLSTIDVSDPKIEPPNILREVGEEMTDYIVTLRGKPVAILGPLNEDETMRLR